ncbi:MAG: lysophospholipid acyltransferase family protein, partial [Pseudomonadales bacterium]
MKRVALQWLVRLLAWLPVRAVDWSGALIGRALWRLDSRMARTTRTNLTIAFPELCDDERQRLGRRSLEQTCALALEAAAVWGSKVEHVLKRVVSVQGRELIGAAIARGRGVIVLAPHLGNWEIANLYVARHCGVTALYQPSGHVPLDDLVRKFRERGGSRMKVAGTGGIRSVLKALKGGQCVGVLPDQVPVPKQGVVVDFFGHAALTMTLVHRLAVRTGARVVCVYAQRLDNGAFYIRFRGVADDLYDSDPSVSAQAMNDAVEQCV